MFLLSEAAAVAVLAVAWKNVSHQPVVLQDCSGLGREMDWPCTNELLVLLLPDSRLQSPDPASSASGLEANVRAAKQSVDAHAAAAEGGLADGVTGSKDLDSPPGIAAAHGRPAPTDIAPQVRQAAETLMLRHQRDRDQRHHRPPRLSHSMESKHNARVLPLNFLLYDYDCA